MPGLDGTGPKGKGPFTGRGLGKCFRNVSGSAKLKLISIAIPTVVAIVDDIRRPDSITRKIYNSLKSGIFKSQKMITEKSNIDEKKIANKSNLEDS